MLYIDRNDGLSSWHIGEEFPVTRLNIHHINSIQADNDELDKILTMFTPHNTGPTIPRTTRRVMYWYGDIARTICLTLLYDKG